MMTGAAYGAGYTCPESKRYTSCNEDYYMTPNTNVGNSCARCDLVPNFTQVVKNCTRPCSVTNGTCQYEGTERNDIYHYIGNGAITTEPGVSAGCTPKLKQQGECTDGTRKISCNASFYLSGETCPACATGQYSTKGMNSCAACTGKPANSHYTGKGTSETGCPWDCDTGYQKNGNTCCNLNQNCSVLNSGNQTWTGTYNACTAGDENTKCTTSCQKSCSTAMAPCPEHASSCEHDTTHTTSGTLTYGNRNNMSQCQATVEACPITKIVCEDGYKLTSDNKCVLNQVTCDAGKYLPMGTLTCTTCPAGSWCPGNQTFDFSTVIDQGINSCGTGKYCPAGAAAEQACPATYPNSDANSSLITQCYSNELDRPWTGTQNTCPTPDNCAGATCNDCKIEPCKYVAYSNADGTGDGTLKDGCAINNASCDQTVDTVMALPGFVSNNESKTCDICPEGKSCAGGDSQPEDCPAGKICTGGTVTECPAGSYCPSGSTETTPCPEGAFCPAGSETPLTCPVNTDGSDEPRDNITTCYQLCDLTVDDVDYAQSLTPKSDRVYASEAGLYAVCEYELVCRVGYVDTIDSDTQLPFCQDMRRTVTLDDQKPTTPAGIKTVYLMTGGAWYADPEMTTQISGIEVPPTKTGYEFGGYYTAPNGQGTQIVDQASDFVVLALTGNTAKIYAYWIPGITTCAAGEYYTNSVGCTSCLADNYCPGGDFRTEGGTQGLNTCADLGDGSWHYSMEGSATAEQCYRTCESHAVEYGTAYPVNATENWPVACSFNGMSETGNPCDIIDDRCVETSCSKEFELVGGMCTPCARENAVSYKDGANCYIQGCVDGYHPNAGGVACVENTIECEAPNAVEAYQTWDYKQQAFSACTIKTCNDGYHVTANACVLDEQACVVEHGTGVKEWDFVANAWGPCTATQCDPGYTNDPAQTTDTAQQCGRCRNHFSVLGTPAASSYIRECEIASCMYQGELYILRDNECEPICDINGREDETGFMKWNPSTGKCDRTCKTGYTMW